MYGFKVTYISYETAELESKLIEVERLLSHAIIAYAFYFSN